MLSLRQRTEVSFGKSSNGQSNHLLAWAGHFQKNSHANEAVDTELSSHGQVRFWFCARAELGDSWMTRRELQMACTALEGNVSNW